MFKRENPENLVCERLSDSRDTLEIKQHRLELVYSREKTLTLRARYQFVVSILGKSHWHYGFGESVVIAATVLVEDFFDRPRCVVVESQEHSSSG